MIGVSPTYMSKVERDEFPPPVEDKVRAIAEIIECDVTSFWLVPDVFHPTSPTSSNVILWN